MSHSTDPTAPLGIKLTEALRSGALHFEREFALGCASVITDLVNVSLAWFIVHTVQNLTLASLWVSAEKPCNDQKCLS